jgi:hypothetical protein
VENKTVGTDCFVYMPLLAWPHPAVFTVSHPMLKNRSHRGFYP